jgi:3-oxoacid CoA-transferase subunit A
LSGKHRNKVKADVKEALADLKSGSRVMVGGFGLCGNPEALIRGVLETGAKDLWLVSNNAGNLGKGLATWLEAGIIRKVTCSYIGTNDLLHQKMAKGEVEVEMIPQGTLAERMRAAGAGIPAFYTPTGAGTVVAEGKEKRVFSGREYILEHALDADFALIRADKGDRFGNLCFRKTARNFSPVMATAARTTIVEVDNLVNIGQIDPDGVHLSGIFVHRVVEIREHENPFEYRTVRKRDAVS